MYTAPIIAVLYLIPALNLGGIPPFSGFMGKVMLFHAGAEANTWMSWVLIGGAVVTSLLTLYVMVMVWSKGFLRDRKDAPEGNMAIARPAPLADITQEVEFSERESVGRTPFGMIAATAMLVLASSAISVVAGPIASITDRAANSTQDVNIYRTAVLGTDPSEPTRNLELERLDDGEDRREESEENTESSTSVKGGDS